MKKVAHECPIAMLEDSRRWNYYDYCLVHLLSQYPCYSDFFKKSLEIGREVVLDNSIFELGKSFDIHKFAEAVLDLKPTYYIIPDVLEDCEGTVNNLSDWCRLYGDIPGKKIGVVQGKTYSEIVECYRFVNRFCDKIAISFDYSYYLTSSPSNNKYISWMCGRSKLLLQLLSDRVINLYKPHHLLGCSCVEEFGLYRNKIFSFIESIDTSSPIVYGLLNMRYDHKNIFSKPSIKLAELIERVPTKEQLEYISDNIYYFNNIVNG